MTQITKEAIEAAKSAYWHEAHNGGGYSDKCYEAALTAAIPFLPIAVEAPAGWQLVPVNPTIEMNNVGQKWIAQAVKEGVAHCQAFYPTDIYKAMLAAAPVPPSSPGKDGGQEVEVGGKRWRVFENIFAGEWGIEEDDADGEVILPPRRIVREHLDDIVARFNAAGKSSPALQTAIYRLCVIEASPNLNEGEKALVRDWISEARSALSASTSREGER